MKRVTTATGQATVLGQTFTIQTSQRIEVIDLTERVMALTREAGVREGIASAWPRCTRPWRSSSTSRRWRCSPTSANSSSTSSDRTPIGCTTTRRTRTAIGSTPDSHLRALLLGHSVTLPVSGGEVVLGRWQRLLMAELDGPRERTLRLTVIGVA